MRLLVLIGLVGSAACGSPNEWGSTGRLEQAEVIRPTDSELKTGKLLVTQPSMTIPPDHVYFEHSYIPVGKETDLFSGTGCLKARIGTMCGVEIREGETTHIQLSEIEVKRPEQYAVVGSDVLELGGTRISEEEFGTALIAVPGTYVAELSRFDSFSFTVEPNTVKNLELDSLEDENRAAVRVVSDPNQTLPLVEAGLGCQWTSSMKVYGPEGTVPLLNQDWVSNVFVGASDPTTEYRLVLYGANYPLTVAKGTPRTLQLGSIEVADVEVKGSGGIL